MSTQGIQMEIKPWSSNVRLRGQLKLLADPLEFNIQRVVGANCTSVSDSEAYRASLSVSAPMEPGEIITPERSNTTRNL